MAQTKTLEAGDVIIHEENELMSRETLTVLASNTFVLGQVGCIDNAGKVNTIANAQDDVYTLTHVTTADGGTFALSYRGDAIAAQAWNVSTADLQTALRALHADLDACVVAGTAGTAYTVTVTHEKKSNLFHLGVAQDSVEDGGVYSGTHLSRTTYAEQAGVIALEACAESSDASRVFLVRNAIVDASNVTGQSSDINKRLAEPKAADDFENQAGYGNIIVRTGPTYTTL